MNGRFEVEIFDPAGVGIDDLLEVASLEGCDPFRVITVDPEGVIDYSRLKNQLLSSTSKRSYLMGRGENNGKKKSH
jgi:hypothetical protein